MRKWDRGHFFYKLFILVIIITSLSVFVTALVLTASNAKTHVNRINVQVEDDVRDLHKKFQLQLMNMESTIHMLSLSSSVKNLDVEKIELEMEEVSVISPYLFIYVTDETGKQLYKTYGDLIDISDREYFQEAIVGEVNYSDVIVSRTQLHPVVIYARPVVNNGEIVGVIAGAIDVSYLSELNGVAMEEGRISYIVDSSGTVVIHPNQALTEGMENLSDRPYVKAVLEGDNDTGQYIVDGKKKLVSYMPLEQLSGGVIVEMEAEEVFDSVDKMMNQAILIILFVVIIGATITYAVVKRMSRSLMVLKEQINKAAEGRMEIDIDEDLISGKGELSSISRDFQRMVKKKSTHH